MRLDDSGRQAVAAAIAAAEATTSGEIVCVVDPRGHRYPATGLTVAALIAFTLPLAAVLAGADFAVLMPWREWSVGALTDDVRAAIEAYALVQVVVFVAVAALTVWTPLGAALTPRPHKRARVRAEAMSQFRARSIGNTRDRTGVLIFVSVADRLAEVVADEGIYAKVSPDHWATTVAALVGGIGAGDPARGFVEAVGLAGKVLAEHFPPLADNPNELPDRLIEL